MESITPVIAGAHVTSQNSHGSKPRSRAESKPVVKPEVTSATKDFTPSINEILVSNSKLTIRHDKEENQYVYEFHDPESGKLIARYPAESVLETIRSIAKSEQNLAGVILNNKA